MMRAREFVRKLLFPPLWIVCTVPPVVFAALICLFAFGKKTGVFTYAVYFLSAYSLTILVLRMPGMIRRGKATFTRYIDRYDFAVRYRDDLAFRGGVGIFRGIVTNFLYAGFRIALGILYTSVWFISVAVYYSALGVLRLSLFRSYRRRGKGGEVRCYRRTAWLLFLLNVPMGGMIFLMVVKNSAFSYPGYVIYVSALYTFYTAITSVFNLVRYRRLGSPILSAAKAVNFIAALMSVLCLQTAMIAQFSPDRVDFRRGMNALTGAMVWCAVIGIAFYMLIRSRKMKCKETCVEQIGE